MQFKTENRPMITVYQADVANLRKMKDPDDLHKFVSDQVGSHFKGSMLRVDARFLVEDAAASGMSNARLSDIETLLLKMNIYSVVGIHMRLSDSCLDRWLEVPKQGAYHIRLPEGLGITLGFRRNNGEQDERAIYTSTKAFDERGVDAATHIYIPSTENKEIPIYPCEPFGVKKLIEKSWPKTDSAKVDRGSQSDPAKVDPKAMVVDLDAKCKAADSAIERLKAAPVEPDANTVTLNPKVEASEVTTAIGSFVKAVTDLSREIQVSNLKAAARNPEVREALFKALCKDGDRETLTSLFRLSREALFGIEWDEVNGKTRKPTK